MTGNWYDSIVSAVAGAIEAIFLKKTDIADNLTTNDASKVLSAKQGKQLQDNKQANLVSGTNIKTVNNESLLGSGNITIQGGSNVDVVTSWESTLSDTKVASEKLTKNTIDTKLNANQGSGNSGRFMRVANDGSVVYGGININDMPILTIELIPKSTNNTGALKVDYFSIANEEYEEPL